MMERSQPQWKRERLEKYRQLMTRLATSKALSTGDLATALEQVTSLAAEVLEVDRVSVWRLDPYERAIECEHLYVRGRDEHSQGGTLRAAEAPAYFAALSGQRTLTVADARRDPRTRDMLEPYLGPADIGALLDAPIWVAGHMVGVVCHEHIGEPRRWTLVEELIAGTVADFVARVQEAANRLRAERELSAYRQEMSHISAITYREQERVSTEIDLGFGADPSDDRATIPELLEVIDASPMPLLVMRASDGTVLYANRIAGDLFETSPEKMKGLHAPDFYDDSAERHEFFSRMLRDGRVDGFVARFRGKRGRSFWALMSAQRVLYEGEDCFVSALSDITAQKVAESAVRRSYESLRRLFLAAPVPLVLVRLSDQRVVLTNPAAADLFEIPFEQAPGQQAQQFYVRPEDLEGLASRIEQGHSAKRSSVQLRSAKGRVFWATISGQRVDFEGEPCLLAGVYDITAQKELEERLRELATRDALTGVYNRRYLEEVTAQEHSRVERGTSAPFALLVVDADHFKEVNDKYGHPTGDDVLAALAQACAGALRRGDVFARIGGEEFAAMLPETDASAAGEVGERLRRAVEALEVSTDHGVFLRPTVSIGGAVAKPEESVGSVLDRADKAMYTAKDRGRNKVVISDA